MNDSINPPFDQDRHTKGAPGDVAPLSATSTFCTFCHATNVTVVAVEAPSGFVGICHPCVKQAVLLFEADSPKETT